MSYYYSDGSVKSYVTGVNYGEFMQKALDPNNKSAENKRLSTTSSQDDYFEKQRLVQEAIAQLQSNGYVSPEIAKEVDVESLKESLEGGNNNSSATSMLEVSQGDSKIANNKASFNAATQSSSLASAVNIADKNQSAPSALTGVAESEEDSEAKQTKENILQSVENESLEERKEKNPSFYNEPLVKVSSNPPSNVSEKAKSSYNPLEVGIKSENVASRSSSAVTEIKNSESSTVQNSEFVEFADEVSGKKVRVPLTEENAKRLKEHFGSLEEASDYVKGFYYDAAYTMGYLQSDSNGDGKISLEEGVHLKGLVSLKDGSYKSIAESVGGDLEAQKKLLEVMGHIDNIADFINHSLSQDENFDSSLSLAEMVGNSDKSVFLKVGGGEEVEVFVLQRFKFDFAESSFDDILLNLGATNEDSAQIVNQEDLKSIMNDKYLESLDASRKDEVLKSDKIVRNIVKSA